MLTPLSGNHLKNVYVKSNNLFYVFTVSQFKFSLALLFMPTDYSFTLEQWEKSKTDSKFSKNYPDINSKSLKYLKWNSARK